LQQGLLIQYSIPTPLFWSAVARHPDYVVLYESREQDQNPVVREKKLSRIASVEQEEEKEISKFYDRSSMY